MGDELDVGQRLAALLEAEAGSEAEVAVSISDGGSWARPCVDVPPHLWQRSFELAQNELALDFFDWLSAVDEGEKGFRLVGHLWSTHTRKGLLIRALVPGDEPTVDSVVSIFPGAAWHERETFEMFGISFIGHHNLRKLLLADEFEARPLRKSFVLAARAVKPWPGAVEPGERSDSESTSPTAGRRPAPSRRKLMPPGVPEPGTWGAQ